MALFTALVVFGKVVNVGLGAFLSGHSPASALQAGMSMAQIGEFSFILAGVGVAREAIEPALYGIAVSVAVVTTFLTPWLVRASEPLALALEHRLPKPLRTFASLYGSWLERMRVPGRADPFRFKLLKLAGWLALDVLCFAGVVIGTSLSEERLSALLRAHVGLAAATAHLVVLVAAGLVLAPFAIGIVRLSRAIGAVLAASVLPRQAQGSADFAAAPRRAFVVALQLAVLVVVGGPLLALTQPFVPILYQAGVVAAVLGAVAVSFWRRANDLEAHVRAGAEVVVEVLTRKPEGVALSLDDVHSLLPGLGEVTPVKLEPASPAVGKTLAQLDLRARTGASVIAISRPLGEVIAPTGREVLRAGDVLALAGSQTALAAARVALEKAVVRRAGR